MPKGYPSSDLHQRIAGFLRTPEAASAVSMALAQGAWAEHAATQKPITITKDDLQKGDPPSQRKGGIQ